MKKLAFFAAVLAVISFKSFSAMNTASTSVVQLHLDRLKAAEEAVAK